MSTGVSLRQLSRHIHQPPLPLKLREMLRLGNAGLSLRVKRAPFSLMIQNMALLVPPGGYLGTDRRGAVAEITSRIAALSPDVVGLCEVFSDSERDSIRRGVEHIYPYFHEGPDEDDLESDGGLLLLSKHPLLEKHQVIFRDCAGADCFANKGILYVRVQPPNSPMPYEILFSHMQNIDEDGGKEALYAQLSLMGGMIRNHVEPNIPIIIMGDLNIPGEAPEHYNQLIQRLVQPVDFWTVVGNTAASGFTSTSDNNFYDLPEDTPEQNHRLDYVLMRAGLRFIPILKNIEITKFARNGRFISDHYGLHAQFEQLVEVVT